MDQKSSPDRENNKNNTMVDVEIAELKDESTTFTTEEKQRHKKRRCTTINVLKIFALILCIDLAFLSIVNLVHSHYQNKFLSGCYAAGGRIVGMQVTGTSRLETNGFRCVGVDDDALRG